MKQRLSPQFRTRNVHRNLESLVDEKMAQIKVLNGLLPICAGCQKIRDDEGYWNHLEVFIDRHSEASFSHGICPDCTKQFYKKLPEMRGSPLRPLLWRPASRAARKGTL